MSAWQVPEHAEREDFSSESVEERLHSTHLARRCSAYEELQAELEGGGDKAKAAAVVFQGGTEVALQEALPKGQDAALNALAAYLRHGTIDARHVLPWVRKLADHKCIDKPKLQQLAPAVVLLVAEIAVLRPSKLAVLRGFAPKT